MTNGIPNYNNYIIITLELVYCWSVVSAPAVHRRDDSIFSNVLSYIWMSPPNLTYIVGLFVCKCLSKRAYQLLFTLNIIVCSKYVIGETDTTKVGKLLARLTHDISLRCPWGPIAFIGHTSMPSDPFRGQYSRISSLVQYQDCWRFNKYHGRWWFGYIFLEIQL